ncbi:MAG: putative lipoprotein [Fibrobacteres bacterium]|nr:putative lipoprotein [Fibrobacterota bacterium]
MRSSDGSRTGTGTLAACLMALAALSLIECSHKPKYEAAKNDLYGELQSKKKKLNGKGVAAEVAIGESKNLQTGIDKAELEARAKLSRSLESKTSSLQKKFQEEVGREFSEHFSQAVKSISDQTLRGTTLQETRFEQNAEGAYRVYGLMVLDSDLYMKALAGELDADKATRDRFRASRAYKELNEEIEAFREWKQRESAPESAPRPAPLTSQGS